MDELTDERLAVIAKRCEAASPEPWAMTHDIKRGPKIWTGHGRVMFMIVPDLADCAVSADDPVPQWWKDGDFVIHAPDDIRVLLAEIATLRTALAERDAECERLRAALLLAQADAGRAAVLRDERDAAQARCRELEEGHVESLDEWARDLRARVREVEATLAAQVEVTDRETTRLRAALRDAYNTNHAERIERLALRDRVAALEEGLGRAADTFADFVRTFTLIQRPVVAAAANIAERDARALLAAPTPEPTGATRDVEG